MVDRPSASNKNWVRAVAVAATVAAAARGTAELPAAGAAFVHLLAFGTWFGAIVWTTFIAGLVMFKNLPRQTFGKLQAKLFPMCAPGGLATWAARNRQRRPASAASAVSAGSARSRPSSPTRLTHPPCSQVLWSQLRLRRGPAGRHAVCGRQRAAEADHPAGCAAAGGNCARLSLRLLCGPWLLPARCRCRLAGRPPPGAPQPAPPATRCAPIALPVHAAGLGLASSLLSFAVVEPLATKIMFQRYELENAPRRDEGEMLAGP